MMMKSAPRPVTPPWIESERTAPPSVVTKSTKPKFIIHGEADELIPLKQVREFYAQLADPKELVEIDRANHLFDGQVTEVADALEELLADFTCRTQ